MSLSRFCATALGALMLSCAAHSFAASEDAPLPGDFAPPRQGKISAKTGSSSNGSIKQNDATARNNPPANSATNPDNTSEQVKKSTTSRSHSSRVQRNKNHVAAKTARGARHQGRQHTTTAGARHAQKRGKITRQLRTTSKHTKKVAIHHSRAAKQPKKARRHATTIRRHHARAVKTGANKHKRAQRPAHHGRSKHAAHRKHRR